MSSLSEEIRKKLISLLCSVNVVKYGNFTLKDGTLSPIYIDLRILPNFPKEFQEVINITTNYFIQENLVSQFDGIATPPLAGIPFGVAIAIKLNKEFYLTRMKVKSHGMKKLVEGDIENKRIMIVDDVITSGASKVPIINAIRENKGVPTTMFVFVNRIHNKKLLYSFEKKNQIQLRYLLSLEDLIDEQSKDPM